MRRWRHILLGSVCGFCCSADTFVVGPTPAPGQIGPPAYIGTVVPFYIIQSGWSSMRYEQVYSNSLFTNVPAENIYVTSFRYNDYPWWRKKSCVKSKEGVSGFCDENNKPQALERRYTHENEQRPRH
jgi:hypothetical protein